MTTRAVLKRIIILTVWPPGLEWLWLDPFPPVMKYSPSDHTLLRMPSLPQDDFSQSGFIVSIFIILKYLCQNFSRIKIFQEWCFECHLLKSKFCRNSVVLIQVQPNSLWQNLQQEIFPPPWLAGVKIDVEKSSTSFDLIWSSHSSLGLIRGEGNYFHRNGRQDCFFIKPTKSLDCFTSETKNKMQNTKYDLQKPKYKIQNTKFNIQNLIWSKVWTVWLTAKHQIHNSWKSVFPSHTIKVRCC